MAHDVFIPLNLPPAQLRVRCGPSGAYTVFDPLRHKAVALTPEEWVRQHFVAYMVRDLGYPPSLMANEVGLRINGLSRRCDTVVWRAGSAEPLMIVEYKAPGVKISQRTFDQIVRYNHVFHAPYLVVSNGLEHYVCELDMKTSSHRFLRAMPAYGDITAI